ADRHRASGDAIATTKLFKMLLEKDLEKTIVKDFIKFEIEKGIAPKLMDLLGQMPAKTGTYYIHNEIGTLIYIGKSQNIRKRVNQHFTGITTKSKKIQAEVFTITYDETGSELIALLKESEEIKINRPRYNRSQRKTIFQYALYAEKDTNGYIILKLEKADGRKKEITSFATLQEGKNALFKFTAKYNLCQKLTGLYLTKKECFQYKLKECDGACLGEITPEIYNARVQQFISENSFDNKSMILIDRGRNVNERSAVLIENGVYQGYAYFDLNYQIMNIDILKNILIPMQNNRDVKNIIQNYIRKSKSLKILHF
ncbi:MAG: GIY-YIG nuclease family protein, partial [Flavobacterium sp.]